MTARAAAVQAAAEYHVPTGEQMRMWQFGDPRANGLPHAAMIVLVNQRFWCVDCIHT
jgi:hypothetical protein